MFRSFIIAPDMTNQGPPLKQNAYKHHQTGVYFTDKNNNLRWLNISSAGLRNTSPQGHHDLSRSEISTFLHIEGYLSSIMVSFCCDGCNETMKKQKVARHNCGSNSVSCIDCSVTFFGNDYVKHTSCISEAEKYEKSLYREKKPKSPANKRTLQQTNTTEKSATKRHKNSCCETKESSIESPAESKAELLRENHECRENGETSDQNEKKKSETKNRKSMNNAKELNQDREERDGEISCSIDHDQESNKNVDGKTLTSIITEILREDSKKIMSMGHIRKMTKKRSRNVGIQLTDHLFYSCLNQLGGNIGITLIK